MNGWADIDAITEQSVLPVGKPALHPPKDGLARLAATTIKSFLSLWRNKEVMSIRQTQDGPDNGNRLLGVRREAVAALCPLKHLPRVVTALKAPIQYLELTSKRFRPPTCVPISGTIAIMQIDRGR